MPIRDLTVLFQIIDRASGILDPLLSKMDSIDGSSIDMEVNLDPGQASAQAAIFESSLGKLQEANEKLTSSLEKVAGDEKKEGKEAEAAGKKTKEAGEGAKQASGHFQTLQNTVEGASKKFNDMKSHLDGIKTKLLAIQAVITGIAAVAVMSSAKTETLVEELNGLKGEQFAAPIIEWANEGSGGKAWTSKTQRLQIGADLSEMGYNPDEVKKYGTEIEKYFFQKTAMLKRQGVGNAEDLAQTMAAAEKTGNVRSVERLFSAGAISEDKLSRETERLRMNYEKFAFATDEVVKKQAMHNLMMKELTKTNKDFSGQAVTLEQKLDVLGGKWSSLLSGIGDKLRPAVTMIVDGLITVIDVIDSIPGHNEIFIFLGILITIITTLVSWVLILAPALEFLVWVLGESGVAGAAAGLGGVLATLGGALGSIAGVLGSVLAALAGVIGAIAASPLLPIIAVILAVAAALYLIYTRTTLLQDGFAMLQNFVGRAFTAVLKLWSLVSGGMRGNKSDLLELGTWIRNFLDGLIPGWLSNLFAQAQSIYREALKWFDKIMTWWNSFLKKIGDVYDKIKAMLGLGGNGLGPDMSLEDVKKNMAAYTDDEGTAKFKDASSAVVEAIYNKVFKGIEPSKQDLANIQGYSRSQELEDYFNKLKNAAPAPSLPQQAADKAQEPFKEAAAAVQESGQTYVDNSAQTYNDVKQKTGSDTAAGLASYDPVGFYKDLGGKGVNYLKGLAGQGEEESKDQETPQAAGGATITAEGQLKVHKKEEVIPAKIVEGTGKLGSLLASALSFMNSRTDIEQIISEKMFSQNVNNNNREISQGSGPITVQVTIQAPVTVQITREMDLTKLNINQLIDWSKVSYELEKVVRNTFRPQEG